MINIVEKAVNKAGGISEVARQFKTSRQAVQQWIKKRIPSERVLKLEQLSGITRYQLRPDIYGKKK